MRQPYLDEAQAWPSVCMPGSVSQQEIQPVQRFSINEVHSNAGKALYLPFERPAHTSQHPCSSRLHPAEGRVVAGATHSTSGHNYGLNQSSASLHYMHPTTGPSTFDQRLYRSQQACCGEPLKPLNAVFALHRKDQSTNHSTVTAWGF